MKVRTCIVLLLLAVTPSVVAHAWDDEAHFDQTMASLWTKFEEAHGHHEAGNALWEAGDYEGALEEYEKCAETYDEMTEEMDELADDYDEEDNGKTLMEAAANQQRSAVEFYRVFISNMQASASGYRSGNASQGSLWVQRAPAALNAFAHCGFAGAAGDTTDQVKSYFRSREMKPEATEEETKEIEEELESDWNLVFRIKRFSGTVTFQTSDDAPWVRVRKRHITRKKKLRQGTRIITGFDSELTILLIAANVEVFIAPSSQVTLTKYLIPAGDPNKRECHMDIKYGGVDINVTKEVERTDMRVKTGSIHGSPAGTRFSMSYDPTDCSSSLRVYEGVVEVIDFTGVNDEPFVVGAGTGASWQCVDPDIGWTVWWYY